jgi:hypothetical protein
LYEFLREQEGLDEVNVWTPSAHFAFHGDVGAQFFFKLTGAWGDHKICGFAYFARYARATEGQ